MQEEGFIDVETKKYQVLIGPWAQGKKWKTAGMLNREIYL